MHSLLFLDESLLEFVILIMIMPSVLLSRPFRSQASCIAHIGLSLEAFTQLQSVQEAVWACDKCFNAVNRGKRTGGTKRAAR